jgi:hypothetical protein
LNMTVMGIDLPPRVALIVAVPVAFALYFEPDIGNSPG